jgi:putative CocE/NonD family hydrolase
MIQLLYVAIRSHSFFLGALIFLSLVSKADANEFDINAHYNKSEYMVPMRDGKMLFTAVYSPKDQTSSYPMLFFRTPYSIRAYGEQFPVPLRMAPSLDFIKAGYIFVFQDIRGTYQSEGDFEIMRPIRADKAQAAATDESTDNYDTIDWLLSNVQNHNGKVGQWGVSYSGWTTAMGMVDAHPALAASSPQGSPADMWIGDDFHHNGAFRLMYSFSWMDYTARSRQSPTAERSKPFDYHTPWGYEFFINAGPTAMFNEKYFNGSAPAWNDFIEHPNYDDFWRKQQILPHLKNINHAVLNVAGWFDAEDAYGPIAIYQQIEKSTPHNQSTLVVGPWKHAGWALSDGASLGDIKFGKKTSEYYKENIVFPFFEYHLKGKGDWLKKEAIVFETGQNRWHTMPQWPPKDIVNKNLYFHEDKKLSFSNPSDKELDIGDTYTNDPKSPVPFSTQIRNTAGHTWMIEDQRLASTRPDVLTYKTDILTEDLTIAGPVLINLMISTTGTDADYFVKLIDVYPEDIQDQPNDDELTVKMGGYQMLLGAEVMRAKYRNDFTRPQPLIPGDVTPITFKIWDKFHTFKKGHRIMVQVHSSWFPAYDLNPQQFMNIYLAKRSDHKVASHTIFRSQAHASHITLPVIEFAEE